MAPTSSVLQAVLIPAGILYGVFVHDFGEYEHVFMPARRWLQAQKERFFTLSAEEQRLAERRK